jgi:hypothetical protein
MPAKAKSEPAATRHEASSPFSLLTDWARQGTENFFASQRILLDLVMRQNANAMTAIQDRLSAVRNVPVAAFTEMIGEGVSNLIAVDRVLLHLAQRENEIVVGALQERTGNSAPASAMTNVIRRSIDTFVEMQLHFLTLVGKQADLWVDAAKSGKPFDGKALPEMARESVENFVRAQKKYLDVVAEETANLTNGVTNPKQKKTDLPELAREATEAFIDAQKKVLDVYAQQGDVNLKAARTAFQALNPFQPEILKEFSRNTVENFVTAEKALLDMMAKPARATHNGEHQPPKKTPPHAKRPAAQHEAVHAKRPAAKHEAVPVGA